MSRAPTAAAAAVAALALGALTLAGCVSVLPKSPPAQLYTFGADAAAAPVRGTADTPLQAPGLVLATVGLPRAAAGDGLLAITGVDAAYLARARWVSPAAVLMAEAVQRTFAARAGRLRLLRRDELAGSAGSLSLDVRDFETRYAAPGAAPTVRVAVRAVIAGRDGAVVAERAFGVDRPPAENRLSAIVSAYDGATRQVLGEVADWADGAVQALPPAPRATVVRSTTTTAVVRP